MRACPRDEVRGGVEQGVEHLQLCARALQWLDYAIALPPLVAGLPPDTHDAAHGAPHAAGSGVGDAVSDQPLAGRRPRRS